MSKANFAGDAFFTGKIFAREYSAEKREQERRKT
jgi:hypothetical protein